MTLRLVAALMIAAGTTLAAQTRTTADTASSVSRLLWMGPDTLTGRGREARDVVNAIQSRLTARDSVTFVRFGVGDSTASVDAARGISVVTHRLHKKNDRWVVSDTFAIKVYRGTSRVP